MKTAAPDYIVHICKPADWQAARQAGIYRADSLLDAGFIHFSRPDQVIRTANRYFRGAEELLLLWVDPGRLIAELRWEQSDGDSYPHVYGPLNLDAVDRVTVIKPQPDGAFGSGLDS